MKEISISEEYALRAYLELPARKLLDHEFEQAQDYIGEHVSRFLKGERFDYDFTAFSREESNIINPIITKNISNDDGKDLLTAFLLTKTVCNIMNKYKA